MVEWEVGFTQRSGGSRREMGGDASPFALAKRPEGVSESTVELHIEANAAEGFDLMWNFGLYDPVLV
jgi:hypothetical protein